MKVSDEVQLIVNQIMKDNIEQYDDHFRNYSTMLTYTSPMFVSLVEKRHIYQYITDYLLRDTGIVFLSSLTNELLNKITLCGLYKYILDNNIDLYQVYINTKEIINNYLQESNDETN